MKARVPSIEFLAVAWIALCATAYFKLVPAYIFAFEPPSMAAAFALFLLTSLGLTLVGVAISLNAKRAVAIGLAWTLLCTAAYWILGPFSSLGRPDDRHSSVPWLYYLTHAHDLGLYAHSYAGGLDATAGLVIGTQYLSLQHMVFSTLPIWLAIFVLRAGAIGVAYAGGYCLGRAGFDLSPGKAVVVGLLASAIPFKNFHQSIPDWGISLIPIVFYWLCLTTNSRKYFVGVLAFSVLYSMSASPVYSLPALYVAFAIGATLIRPPNLLRSVVGLLLLTLVSTLNWADVLYAVVQLLPESARAHAVPEPASVADYLTQQRAISVLAGAVGLGLLVLQRNHLWRRALPALTIAFAVGPLLSGLPWSSTNLPPLAGYRWPQLTDGAFLMSLLIVGSALKAPALRIRVNRFTLGTISTPFVAIAVLAAADEVALDFDDYIVPGGEALYTRSGVLANCDWRPPEAFRVVSLPSLFSPGMANAYDLDTFDGQAHSFSPRKNLFWELAVNRPPGGLRANQEFDWLLAPQDGRTLGSAADLDALRLANVRFVLSDRELADPELRLVSASCKTQRFEGIGADLERWLGRWSAHPPARTPIVYELPKPWPRVFVPTTLGMSAAEIDDPAFYREVLAASREPSALVGKSDSGLLRGAMPFPGAYSLSGYRVTPNGYQIDVKATTASATLPGIVVANFPYSVLWHAAVNGRELAVFPVNGVQTAVVLNQVDGPVTLIYQRDTIAGRLFGRST